MAIGNLPPRGGLPYSPAPTGTGTPTGGSGGGNWVWNIAKGLWEFVKDNGGDILQTGAGVYEGYMSSQDRQKQLDELRRQFDENLKQRQAEATASGGQFDRNLAEQQAGRQQSGSQFDRTTGNTEAQLAVQAQTAINKAPVADKAQALLLARMGVAPNAFQGRDYTKGTDDLLRSPTAPGANVTQAMQSAASGYRPGQGGVDVGALKMLLQRMNAGKAVPPTPPAPPTVGEPRRRLPPPNTPLPPEPGPTPFSPTRPFTPPTMTPRLPVTDIPRPPAPITEEEDAQAPVRPRSGGDLLRRRMGVPI